MEITVKHNNYHKAILKYRTTCFGLYWPSSGPQELDYALYNICVSLAVEDLRMVIIDRNM